MIHPAMLREVYGVDADVLADSDGIPIVAPRGSVRQRGDKEADVSLLEL